MKHKKKKNLGHKSWTIERGKGEGEGGRGGGGEGGGEKEKGKANGKEKRKKSKPQTQSNYSQLLFLRERSEENIENVKVTTRMYDQRRTKEKGNTQNNEGQCNFRSFQKGKYATCMIIGICTT